MTEFLFIVAGVIACGLLALQGWAITHLRAQSARVDNRLDALGDQLRSTLQATRTHLVSAPRPVNVEPLFVLTTLNGRAVTSNELLAHGRPLVLVLTDPRCGPCFELLPDLADWQRHHADQATVALVSSGAVDSNRAMTAEFDIDPGLVLLQTEHELFAALGAEQLPAAVIIAPDGSRPGSLVYGAEPIRAALSDLFGTQFVPSEPVRTETLQPGAPAPVLRRPDLDGNLVNLAEWRGERSVVLFWSPGCSHCQELLPAINAWNRDAMGARLLVISRGPTALNREAMPNAMVVLDDDRSIAAAFGVTGTPAAAIVSPDGLMAAEVARGTRAVSALITYLARQGTARRVLH